MANDLLEKLLHDVALGKINVKDAKKALEGVDLEKEDFQKAVDFGVFTEAEPGTVIKATISPSGGSHWICSHLNAWRRRRRRRFSS